MNPELPDEALELAASARRAFADLGGVDLARRIETDPGLRTTVIAPVLHGLGIDDLEPRVDGLSLAAAAALCREAGRVSLPYPLASVLVRDPAGRPTVGVPARSPSVDHASLFPEWSVASLDGGLVGFARPTGSSLGSRLGPFVGAVTVAPDIDDRVGAAVLLQQTLSGWGILGVLEHAVEVTTAHVNTRIQFGKPIAVFQAVQFQLADAAVAVAGLRELALFTLWRVGTDPSGSRSDVLALRGHALDTARSVLRCCQQLHGAAGVCDEYDISILVRFVQPALRLPEGVEQTGQLLAEAVEASGFVGLFDHGTSR